jgi:damage-control phosphatase, subfamily I
MKLSALCMNCLIQRQMENIRYLEDEVIKSNYMKRIFSIISQANEYETAPAIIAKISKLHQEYFGSPYSFESLKEQYNSMMLQKEESIWDKILTSDDCLLEALKYSRLGNYIDFGAMGSIDDYKLNNLLESVHQEYIEMAKYQEFMKDLQNASELVYLTDNCGEVVLDKLFIKCILNKFPNIHVTAIVRGKMVLNDATMEDARMVGLMEISDVVDNGTEIAGTCLEQINNKAKERIEVADVIISKGQGNFETLNGCGLNIYYLFLCKCEWFVKRFKMEQFNGVFINERDCSIKR